MIPALLILWAYMAASLALALVRGRCKDHDGKGKIHD